MSASQELGAALGLRGPSIVWGRLLAFLLAWMFCSAPTLLVFTLPRGTPPAISYWIAEFFSSLLLAALVVISFRNISGDVGAAVVASVAYALVAPWIHLLTSPFLLRGFSFRSPILALPLLAPLFLLLGLALALRRLRPQWLAIWVGSLAGFVCSYFFYLSWSALYLFRARTPGLLVSQIPEALAGTLVTATVFTLIFYLVSKVA